MGAARELEMHRRPTDRSSSADPPLAAGRPLLLPALAAALLAGSFAGCVGPFSSDSNVLERSAGHASGPDIVTKIPQTLRRRSYTIHDSRRTGRTIYFETNWKSRQPFEDEADSGADLARTRIIVRARQSAGKLFALSIEAQNEVRGVPDAGDWAGESWSTIPATEMFRGYARELIEEIRLEVDAGLRTY